MQTLNLGIDNNTPFTKALGVEAASGKVRARIIHTTAVVTAALLLGGALLFILNHARTSFHVLPALGAVLVLAGMTAGGGEGKKIKAGKLHHAGLKALVYKLSLGNEVVVLDPGKTWAQVDHFKWVARGLLDAPQSFHVTPEGSVEINAARIASADPEGAAKLELEISKRHDGPVAHNAAVTTAPSRAAAAPTGPGMRRFRVKVDHWGHMLIEWGQGLDREETSLRGLAALITNGLIRKPDRYHVDALQRGIEMDDDFYDCSAAGAKRLEEALNVRYAVSAHAEKAVAIEIKENRAASTGFDIHFTVVRAGIPFEIKGHLSQEYLDLLQDQTRCELLQPGIHILLTPPFLLFRRRRPDLGEDKIPGFPDVNLLRITAAQLQAMLNDPLIRRGGTAAAQVMQTGEDRPQEVAEMRVTRNPTDKVLLWLECITPAGQTHGAKAFTHHNIAEFQHGGFFLPNLDVCLSLDHRRLSVLDRLTKMEEAITLDPRSPDETLHQASRILTKALRPPIAAPAALPVLRMVAVAKTPAVTPLPVADLPTQSAPATLHEPPNSEPSVELPAAPAPAVVPQPLLDHITPLFRKSNVGRTNQEIFRRLSAWLGILPQEIHLSVEMVFENRRFEVLSFEPMEIQGLMDLRGEDFYGFYLSHISEHKIVLVYACNGTHIEWGPEKCVLQPTARSEAEEYKSSALLGMAQDANNEFVFIVRPEFKEWIVPREQPYTVENVQFHTVADLAAAPENYRLIWPELPAPPG